MAEKVRICTEVDKCKRRDRAKKLKRTRAAAGLCVSCGLLPPTRNISICQPCADKLSQYDLERSARLKTAAFNAYGGPFCSCCSEDIIDFLTIDHINGDGAKHRKSEKSGSKIYRWLKKHNYPLGFQVLCSNCQNRWKCPDGVCPHKLAPR
jgi:hypothetical protein